MTRKFSFITEEPKLNITMKDGTELDLILPTVSLIERLQVGVKNLKKVITEKNIGSVKQYYELAAELLSCNTEDKKFTAEDLETTQHLQLEDLVLFFAEYTEFVTEARNAKN